MCSASSSRFSRRASAELPESESLAEETKTTVIPIPVIPASKNEGASFGTLVPIFRSDSKGQIQDLIMPLLLYNQDLFGVKVGMNYYKYWPNERVLKLTGTYGTKIERRLRLDYLDRNFSGGRHVLDINLEMDKTASERFFGFTQQSLLPTKRTTPCVDPGSCRVRLETPFALDRRVAGVLSR